MCVCQRHRNSYINRFTCRISVLSTAYYLTTLICAYVAGKVRARLSVWLRRQSLATRTSPRTSLASFKIGEVNDICFAAWALACGCSSSTAVHARAAVTKPKPQSAPTKDDLESEARRHLHAYIRDICKPLEHAPTVRNKEHKHELSCSREAISTRWQTYVDARIAVGQKVWGSRSLFARVWSTHTEILQQRVTGHDVCDRCGELDAEEGSINHRTPEGQAQLRKVHQKRKVSACPNNPPTHAPPHTHTH